MRGMQAPLRRSTARRVMDQRSRKLGQRVVLRVKKEELLAIKKEEDAIRQQAASLLMAETSKHQDDLMVLRPGLPLPTNVSSPADLDESDVGTVVTLPRKIIGSVFPDGFIGDFEYLAKGNILPGWLYRKQSHLLNLLVQKFVRSGSVPRKAEAVRHMTDNSRGILVYGASGAGKSILLSQAVHAARRHSDVITVVLRAPDLTHDPSGWVEPSITYPGYWDSPIETARILGQLRDAHGALLKKLPMKLQWGGLLGDVFQVKAAGGGGGGGGKKQKGGKGESGGSVQSTGGGATLFDLVEWALNGCEDMVAASRATRVKRSEPFTKDFSNGTDRYWTVEHKVIPRSDALLIGGAAVLEELLVCDAQVMLAVDGINYTTSWTHYAWHPTAPSWAQWPHMHGIPAERLTLVRWMRLFMAPRSVAKRVVTAPFIDQAAGSAQSKKSGGTSLVASSVEGALATGREADALTVPVDSETREALEMRRARGAEALEVAGVVPEPGETAVEQANRVEAALREAERLCKLDPHGEAETAEASDGLRRRLVIATTDEGKQRSHWALHPFHNRDVPLAPMHVGNYDEHEYRALMGWLYDTHPIDDRRAEWRGLSKGTREQIMERIAALSARMPRLVTAEALRVSMWNWHSSGVFEMTRKDVKDEMMRLMKPYKTMQWTPHMVAKLLPGRDGVAEFIQNQGLHIAASATSSLDPETAAAVEERRRKSAAGAGIAQWRASSMADATADKELLAKQRWQEVGGRSSKSHAGHRDRGDGGSAEGAAAGEAASVTPGATSPAV